MARPYYTSEALIPYFERVRLPEEYQRLTITHLDPSEQYDYLALLMRYTSVAVPFENISLHYSQAKTIAIDHDFVYRKIVGTYAKSYFESHVDEESNVPLKVPRGGYCMEINQFFGCIMRTLGYEACPVGGRVYGNAEMEGWGHMINLVTIGGRVFSVDLGFGANQAMHPLPLPVEAIVSTPPGEDIIGPAINNLPGTIIRLIYSDPSIQQPGCARSRDGITHTVNHSIPAIAQPQTKAWIYQVKVLADKDGKEGEWTSKYGFTTQEFLPQDYIRINAWTSSARSCFFTYQVLCVRALSIAEIDDKSSPVVSALHAADSTWHSKWIRFVDTLTDSTRLLQPSALAGQVVIFERSLKIRVANDTYSIAEFKAEADRISALQTYFGIRLTSDEKRGINGMVTEIATAALPT